MTTQEDEILARIRLAVGGRPGTRLFRNQVGQGAAGRIIDRPGPGLLLVQGRPVTMGLCTGSSDLVGWRSVTVTPDMVGAVVALFAAVEVKRPRGRGATEEQVRFIEAVRAAGGIAGIARSAAEAAALLDGGPALVTGQDMPGALPLPAGVLP